MKILVISAMFPCKRLPTSGIFFANLLRELRPHVDDMIVITPRVYVPKWLMHWKKSARKWYIDPEVSEEGGIRILRPHVLSLPGIPLAGINGILIGYGLRHTVKRILSSRKVDLVLGYRMMPEGIATVMLARHFGLPSGFWVIGSDMNIMAKKNRVNEMLTRNSIRRSRLVITESRDLENSVAGFVRDHPRIVTFYKGVDVANFANLPPRQKIFHDLKLDPAIRYVVFVGRIIRGKGIEELARSFVDFTRSHPDHHLILAGQETEKSQLIPRFRDGKVSDRVHFMGILPYEKVAWVMKISDVLVLPSQAEGLPNVVMEAMACGVPVVASNVGGIPEVVVDGVTGLSVPCRDSEALTRALTRMIDDQRLRKTCITNARRLILNHFDVKRNVSILVRCLEDTIRA